MKSAVLLFCFLFFTGCGVEKKPTTTDLFTIKPQILAPQHKENHFCDPNYVPPKGQMFEPPNEDCPPVDCRGNDLGIIKERCPVLL